VADDFDQAPVFQFAHRARFHDADLIADLGGGVLVMHVELFGFANFFAVKRVADAPFDAWC